MLTTITSLHILLGIFEDSGLVIVPLMKYFVFDPFVCKVAPMRTNMECLHYLIDLIL